MFVLAQLSWKIYQNARKASGEYDGVTRETLRLHAVLQRLQQEVVKEDSPIHQPGDTSKEQLEHIASDCGHVLKQLDKMVATYPALTEEKRSSRKIWQTMRFSNEQMANLDGLRSKVVLYTSEMLFYLNLVSMRTVGRIEQQMVKDGGVLKDIKIAVEKKTAHSVLSGVNVDGSILTRYTDDDTGFWRELRRELVDEGLPSAVIHKHKHLIKAYVKELGTRGVFDDGYLEAKGEQYDSEQYYSEQYDSEQYDSEQYDSEQYDSDAVCDLLEIYEPPHDPDIDLDASKEARDKSHDQYIALQASEDDQDLLLDDRIPGRNVVEIESRLPRTDARAILSEGSTKSESSSDRERHEQGSQSTYNSSDSSDSESDLETREGSGRPMLAISWKSGKQEDTFKGLSCSRSHHSYQRVRCIKCSSDDVPIYNTTLLSCEHRWCNACLRSIFRLSATERQHMPPVCCKQDCINPKEVDKLFDGKFKRQWDLKFLEYNTKILYTAPQAVVGHRSSRDVSMWTAAMVPPQSRNNANADIVRCHSS